MEAFSDIVIGFSLAQVTISLSPETFFNGSKYFLTFLVTYSAVAVIWWTHNRLFAKYFVPDAFGIVLNFVALGATILFVFSTQVVMASNDSARGLPLYFGAYGSVYLILGILYLLGAHRRRALLSEFDYRVDCAKGRGRLAWLPLCY